MKVMLTDGYIIIDKRGNTYLGKVAHELMHIADKSAREFNVDFNTSLLTVIKTFLKVRNEYSK